jgi:hypothetical protein
MDIRQCPRHPDMQAAHDDYDVREAARIIAQLRNQAILRLAVTQLAPSGAAGMPFTRTLAPLVRAAAFSPEQEAAAYDLMRRCHAIATKPDHPGPSIRRGAFLERMVVELLTFRGVDSVRAEVQLRFAAEDLPCWDVVGLTDPLFEVFECKMIPDELEPGTLVDMRTLIDLADAEVFPKDVVPTIATLFPAAELADAISRNGLTVPEGIFQATVENILGLSIGRATLPLR